MWSLGSRFLDVLAPLTQGFQQDPRDVSMAARQRGAPARRSTHANCVGDVLYVTPVSAPLPLARAELNLEATHDCRRDWKYSLAVGKGQEPDFGEQRVV